MYRLLRELPYTAAVLQNKPSSGETTESGLLFCCANQEQDQEEQGLSTGERGALSCLVRQQADAPSELITYIRLVVSWESPGVCKS